MVDITGKLSFRICEMISKETHIKINTSIQISDKKQNSL